MYSVLVQGLHGFFSTCTPMEHHVHPILEASDIDEFIVVVTQNKTN